MKGREAYTVRAEMALMHDDFLSRLDRAMKKKQYVEASWLCYAIFEQRITRLILKHISQCPKQPKEKNSAPVSISTKISCLKELVQAGYGGYAAFDSQLLSDLEKWCRTRNALVHGLVSLEHYKQYDKEFATLAKVGEPLVKRLYKESTKLREWWYTNKEFGTFPEFKCKCKKQRCVYEEK